jgi:hypothetical protein
MKDLIIGCSTNYTWDVLKFWVNSVNSSGFTGDKVMILMNCDKQTAKMISDSGFKIISFGTDAAGNLTYKPGKLPVHVDRFLHIYDYLQKNEYRYVITTDVRDVVFQRNPVEYIEQNISDKLMIFSSESMLYKDEPWGDRNLLDTYGPYIHNIYKHNEIYNVGVLAGTGAAIRDLTISIVTAAINRPIPICDQSTFNFMINSEPYRASCFYTKSEDGWTCQLGTTADPTKISAFRPNLLEPSPVLRDSVITTSTGKEYYIVHQYDRVPQFRSVIEKKYQ